LNFEVTGICRRLFLHMSRFKNTQSSECAQELHLPQAPVCQAGKNHFLRGPGAFGKSGNDVAVAPHATIVGIRVRAGNTCPAEQPAASGGGGADAEPETPATSVVGRRRRVVRLDLRERRVALEDRA
jgi:hypothetical protein